MLGIHSLWLFVLSGVLLNITPGPDTAYIVGRSIQIGWRGGAAAALGIASPTVAWADTAFAAMHGFRAPDYPAKIRQPILMMAAGNDTVVSTAAIEEFAYHLRGGAHLVIPGARHEILQDQDRFRGQFWAAFDAFVPGTPAFS